MTDTFNRADEGTLGPRWTTLTELPYTLEDRIAFAVRDVQMANASLAVALRESTTPRDVEQVYRALREMADLLAAQTTAAGLKLNELDRKD